MGRTSYYSHSYWVGEILLTPVQLANLAATVANEGYFTPHIVKNIKGGELDKNILRSDIRVLISNIINM